MMMLTSAVTISVMINVTTILIATAGPVESVESSLSGVLTPTVMQNHNHMIIVHTM